MSFASHRCASAFSQRGSRGTGAWVLGVLRFGKEGRARSRHDGLHRQRLGGVPVRQTVCSIWGKCKFFVQQNSDPRHRCMMSTSLIGRSGSSAIRLSTATVWMSLTGSCFSSESAQGPSIMGFEDEVEQSLGRPCRRTDGRSKRTYDLTSSAPVGSGLLRRALPASSHRHTAISRRFGRSRPIDTWKVSVQTQLRLP
jgi:hypothetical protein